MVTVHFSRSTNSAAPVDFTQTASATGTASFDFVVSAEGSNAITFFATDTSSTSSAKPTHTAGFINIDKTAPTVTAISTPSRASGWYNSDVTVALTATDTVPGVQKTQYRKQGAAFWTDLVGDEVTLTTADDTGIFTYEYQAVDWAGNPSSAASIVVNIDSVRPTTFSRNASGKVHKSICVKYEIKDNLSPEAQKIYVKIKNSKGKTVKTQSFSATKSTFKWYSFNWKSKAKGTYKYYVYAKDLAGNPQSSAGWAKVKVK